MMNELPNWVLFVDLGLPSGTLWCAMNVGASSEKNIGSIYSWGESEVKDSNTSDNYTYQGQSLPSTIIRTQGDPAKLLSGGVCQMPSRQQIQELIDNCDFYHIHNTVDISNRGYAISRINGNKIYIPAYGWRDGTDLSGRWTHQTFWCGESSGNEQLYFNLCSAMSDTISGIASIADDAYYRGLPIRAVKSGGTGITLREKLIPPPSLS